MENVNAAAAVEPRNGQAPSAEAQEILNSIANGQKELSELNDDQRTVIIFDFNDRNKGTAKLLEERASEEYQQQCKKDYEDYQSEYLNIPYEIAKPDKALEYAEWLREWNTNHVALPQNYWVGCLKFEEVIVGIIDKLKKEPKENLEFDYAALTYVYNLMMGPVGFGIGYAKWMLDNQKTYTDILETLNSHMETINLIRKKIALLQIKWSLAVQGFVLEWDESLKGLSDLSLLAKIDTASLG